MFIRRFIIAIHKQDICLHAYFITEMDGRNIR
jgi:hypothetical protein